MYFHYQFHVAKWAKPHLGWTPIWRQKPYLQADCVDIMRPQPTHDNHLPLKQACVLIARTGFNVKIVYEIKHD